MKNLAEITITEASVPGTVGLILNDSASATITENSIK